ncbi:hypothetical protein H9P43_004633 [Blastocladiella emersonii ATCC 22665]|nr:hypothetical protein H9P43_004633 [Blastocladiella emersonii ATCC 22665]
MFARLREAHSRGPHGTPLSLPELELMIEAPYSPSVFGDTLDETMRRQRLEYPRTLMSLRQAVLELGGLAAEGIFRVPIDADTVTELHERIDRNRYDAAGTALAPGQSVVFAPASLPHGYVVVSTNRASSPTSSFDQPRNVFTMAAHGQDPVPTWFTRDAHLFLSGHVLEMRDWFEMNRVMGMPEIQYVPVGQPATGIIAVETSELEPAPLVPALEAAPLVPALEIAPLVSAIEAAPLVSAPEAAPLVSAPETASLISASSIDSVSALATTETTPTTPAAADLAPADSHEDAVEHLAADLAVADSGSQEHLVPAPSAAATSTSKPLSIFNKFAGKVVDALAAPFKCLRASASLLSLSGTPVVPLTVPEQQLHLEIDTAAVKISTPITPAGKQAKPLKTPKDSKLRRAARFAFNKVAGIVTRADGLDQGDASAGAEAARLVLEVPSRDLAKALTALAASELVKTVDKVRAAARGVESADPKVLGSAVAKVLEEKNKTTVHTGVYNLVKLSVKGAASLDDAVVQKWIRVAEHCLRSNSDFSTLNAISLALEFIGADKAFTMAPHERRALKRILALNNVCDKTKGIKMLMENKMMAATSANCTPRMVPLVAPVLATLCTAEVSTVKGSYAKNVAMAVEFFGRVEMPLIAPAPDAVFVAVAALI